MDRVPAIKVLLLPKDTARPTPQPNRIGRTSMTVRVSVVAERWGAGHGERVKVTEADVVLVAVNDEGRPVTIHSQSPHA
jgi:acyl-CoA thioesterase YciA